MKIHTLLTLARLPGPGAHADAGAALSAAMLHGNLHLLAGAYRAVALPWPHEKNLFPALGPLSAAQTIAEAGGSRELAAALLLDEADLRLSIAAKSESQRIQQSTHAIRAIRQVRRTVMSAPSVLGGLAGRTAALLAKARENLH